MICLMNPSTEAIGAPFLCSFSTALISFIGSSNPIFNGADIKEWAICQSFVSDASSIGPKALSLVSIKFLKTLLASDSVAANSRSSSLPINT